MSNRKHKPPTTPTNPTSRPFPPRRDFSSLSVRDLLDAREAYHVYLSNLDNVVATAIGRYRIHEKDWYATHPPDVPRPDDYPLYPQRTLCNSIVKPWSWPAVLVFVREWDTPGKLGDQVVPRSLYLPDGRVIPTCVIEAKPDETLPPPVPGPSQVSPLLGGGYASLRQHQGVDHVGTFGCLVYKEGSYYALTNRHVAGRGGDIISAYVHGDYHRVGLSADMGITRILMSNIFPSWPGDKTYLTLDAGLVSIDDFEDWTSQVFGVGEIGAVFDATEQTITLDLIGCAVRGFGGTTGVIEGEIQALFFRYESLGGFDYTTDLLIGPRSGEARNHETFAPFTRPGDSGTLWFHDPPEENEKKPNPDLEAPLPPARGLRARRLRPIAMQWGGQRFKDSDNTSSAFALGSFISSICSALDVEIVRDWSTGHDEYWGKLGHFAVGWKACDQVSGKLGSLMGKNQARIGFGDEDLGQGSAFRMGSGAFVPLADVPDYVWVNSRPNEPIQHFADVDIYDIDGGPTLLERCYQDPTAVSAKTWKEYFDGFANVGVGPEEGALPFRVWQIWEAMVKYLQDQDVIHFVAAAGVLAHYIGDASQPLHCSYLHHGVPPMVKHDGRNYPVRRDSDEFQAFKATREAKIHGIYEETMLEIDTPKVLVDIDEILQEEVPRRYVQSGHGAAVETIRLMYEAQQRLSPLTIIKADDPEPGPKTRAKALWQKSNIRKATEVSLSESVRVLGDLWASAWREGQGSNIDSSELVEFDEGDLEEIYREEKDFVPSLSLARMAQSGKFEPPQKSSKKAKKAGKK